MFTGVNCGLITWGNMREGVDRHCFLSMLSHYIIKDFFTKRLFILINSWKPKSWSLIINIICDAYVISSALHLFGIFDLLLNKNVLIFILIVNVPNNFFLYFFLFFPTVNVFYLIISLSFSNHPTIFSVFFFNCSFSEHILCSCLAWTISRH